MANAFGSPAPIFRVTSVQASLAYYTDALGFAPDWGDDGLVSVSRDRCTIFLTAWDQGCHGSWVWIGVDDVGALYDELIVRGARIRTPPTNYSWAFEMQIEDPDGNVLRLGSESRTGVPYGDFMDAAGVRWPMGDSIPPDGGSSDTRLPPGGRELDGDQGDSDDSSGY